MSLNLRNLGVKWHDAKLGLTLWVHSGSSFWKYSEVQARVDELIPAIDNEKNPVPGHFRTGFIISEAFVLDFEAENDELPIVQYLKHRSPFDFESNLQGFRMCLSYEQMMVFHQAYMDTRPNTDTVDDEPTEEEKKSSDSSF